MAYYFENNDSELSEELSFSQHSTISCNHEVSNTNQEPISKQEKKTKPTKEFSFTIESYNQLKQFKKILKYDVPKCDLTNSNVKKDNDSKFSLFSERNDLFVKFSLLEENSNVGENKMKFSDEGNAQLYIKQEEEEPKDRISNKTLSEAVYSKISKGGRASDTAVVRAIKEKGPNGVSELFSNIKSKKNPKLSFQEANPRYSESNRQSESQLRTSTKKKDLSIDSKSTNSISNKDLKLTDNIKQKMSPPISTKTIDVQSEIKSKGVQRVSDLFSDVKLNSVSKNKTNDARLIHLDNENMINNKTRKSMTKLKDQQKGYSTSDIFPDVELEDSVKNESVEKLKIPNAGVQSKSVFDSKKKEIDDKEELKSSRSKSVNLKTNTKERVKSTTKIKGIELNEHDNLNTDKLIQPKNMIAVDNSHLLYQEPKIHSNHDKANMKPHNVKKVDHPKIVRKKSKNTEKDEISLNDSLRTFDLNVCEICNGFLDHAKSGKYRCLCDFKNSEQRMWRRHSLERMNDISFQDVTNAKLGVFNKLSRANPSFLIELDNSFMSPEQKKKLKLLKKKNRKKTSKDSSFQSPNYIVNAFIITRRKSV